MVVVQKQRNFGPDIGPGGTISISAANKVRRGDIRHAVIVRTAKKYQRKDGSVVKFGDNACVLINKAGEPIGTRLNGECIVKAFINLTVSFSAAHTWLTSCASGVVGAELRNKQWSKILSLAPMHI